MDNFFIDEQKKVVDHEEEAGKLLFGIDIINMWSNIPWISLEDEELREIDSLVLPYIKKLNKKYNYL